MRRAVRAAKGLLRDLETHIPLFPIECARVLSSEEVGRAGFGVSPHVSGVAAFAGFPSFSNLPKFSDLANSSSFTGLSGVSRPSAFPFNFFVGICSSCRGYQGVRGVVYVVSQNGFRDVSWLVFRFGPKNVSCCWRQERRQGRQWRVGRSRNAGSVRVGWPRAAGTPRGGRLQSPRA